MSPIPRLAVRQVTAVFLAGIAIGLGAPLLVPASSAQESGESEAPPATNEEKGKESVPEWITRSQEFSRSYEAACAVGAPFVGRGYLEEGGLNPAPGHTLLKRAAPETEVAMRLSAAKLRLGAEREEELVTKFRHLRDERYEILLEMARQENALVSKALKSPDGRQRIDDVVFYFASLRKGLVVVRRGDDSEYDELLDRLDRIKKAKDELIAEASRDEK